MIFDILALAVLGVFGFRGWGVRWGTVAHYNVLSTDEMCVHVNGRPARHRWCWSFGRNQAGLTANNGRQKDEQDESQ